MYICTYLYIEYRYMIAAELQGMFAVFSKIRAIILCGCKARFREFADKL